MDILISGYLINQFCTRINGDDREQVIDRENNSP